MSDSNIYQFDCVNWYFTMILICTSLITGAIDHLQLCQFTYFIKFSQDYFSFPYLCSSLYIQYNNHLPVICTANIFFHSLDYLLILFMVSQINKLKNYVVECIKLFLQSYAFCFIFMVCLIYSLPPSLSSFPSPWLLPPFLRDFFLSFKKSFLTSNLTSSSNQHKSFFQCNNDIKVFFGQSPFSFIDTVSNIYR